MVRTEESIFLEAMAKGTPEEREAYLLKSCGQDIALLSGVRRLLLAYERGQYLEPDQTSEKRSPSDCTTRHEIGRVIGPYTIREQIGVGGMGLVYVAEQEQPIRRKVALKLIKPGMDSREVIARFEAERQALAMMDHPHIARVLDAGTTESGLPYFVMELVHGVRITEFCDRQRLTLQDRLQLFVDVCRAVQHAHQRGIIHRDIKPSNVLVTLHDGRPVAKVIDFGVAKALTEKLTDKTVYTSYGHLIGTPMYMSPEQAEMSGLPLDTRTDVYSLGVLLYRLLTGTTPFDEHAVRSASFDELRHIICESDPRRPSAQVSTLKGEVLQTITDQRKLDVSRLTRVLRGDLDWVVMKALEKDRNRRYDSVGALADDVERHLRNEPVEARPPSPLYQLRKFYRRQRILLLTAAFVSVSLIVGSAMALFQADRAWRAERIANEQRNHALESEQVMRQLLYAADMRLAADAFLENDVIRAHEALNRHLNDSAEQDVRSFEWYYLSVSANVPVQSLLHSDKAQYVCCGIPETSLVVCGGADDVIRIFDVGTGTLVRSVESGQSEVNGLAVSPDGSTLASAGDDGTVRIWNLQSLQLIRTIPAHGALAFQVAFSPNGQFLISCGDEPDGRVWSVNDGSAIAVLDSRTTDLETLTVTPAGRVALGGRGGVIFVYQLSDYRLVSYVNGNSEATNRVNTVACLGSSAVGAWLAEGHLTGRVNLRPADAPERVRQTYILKDSVQSLAFSPNGAWLAVGDRGGAISLIPLETRKAATSIDSFADPTRRRLSWNAHSGRIYGLTFTADGQQLVSSGRDGKIALWSPMKLNGTQFLTDWTARVLTFERGGTILAAADRLTRYSRRDSEWRPDQVGRDHWTSRHVRFAVARDTGVMAFIREGEKTVRFMSSDGGHLSTRWQVKAGDDIGLISLSPDGRKLAAEIVPADAGDIPANPDGRNRYVVLVDLESGRELSRTPASAVLDLVFSPDAKSLVFGVSRDALLINTSSGAVERILEGHTSTVDGQDFSPDNRLIVTVGERTLRLWDRGSGRELWSVTAHGISAKDVAFTPDGRTLMTIGEDNYLRCWRWAAQRMVLEIPLTPGPVRKLEVSPDSRTVVVRYQDGRVLVIDTLQPNVAE
ncbi:MAG: serine/threonine-protein kinase [Fuerstiella sp.]